MNHDSHSSDQTAPPPSRIHWLLVAVCAVVFIADFIYSRKLEKGVEEIEGIPGFYAVYGFIAIALIVLLSRGLRMAVSRKDGYYDD